MIGLIDRRREKGREVGRNPATQHQGVAPWQPWHWPWHWSLATPHARTHAHTHTDTRARTKSRAEEEGARRWRGAYAVAVPFQAEARRHRRRRRRSGDEKGREQRASSRQAERGRPWSDPNQGRRHRRPFLLAVRSTISLRCPPCKTAPSQSALCPADSPPFSLAPLPYRPQRPPPPPPSADFSFALFTLFLRKLRAPHQSTRFDLGIAMMGRKWGEIR